MKLAETSVESQTNDKADEPMAGGVFRWWRRIEENLPCCWSDALDLMMMSILYVDNSVTRSGVVSLSAALGSDRFVSLERLIVCERVVLTKISTKSQQQISLYFDRLRSLVGQTRTLSHTRTHCVDVTWLAASRSHSYRKHMVTEPTQQQQQHTCTQQRLSSGAIRMWKLSILDLAQFRDIYHLSKKTNIAFGLLWDGTVKCMSIHLAPIRQI